VVARAVTASLPLGRQWRGGARRGRARGEARWPFYNQGTGRAGRAFAVKGYPSVNAVVRRPYSGWRARHGEGAKGPAVKGVRRGASAGFETPRCARDLEKVRHLGNARARPGS
jgi:hypothetical protein